MPAKKRSLVQQVPRARRAAAGAAASRARKAAAGAAGDVPCGQDVQELEELQQSKEEEEQSGVDPDVEVQQESEEEEESEQSDGEAPIKKQRDEAEAETDREEEDDMQHGGEEEEDLEESDPKKLSSARASSYRSSSSSGRGEPWTLRKAFSRAPATQAGAILVRKDKAGTKVDKHVSTTLLHLAANLCWCALCQKSSTEKAKWAKYVRKLIGGKFHDIPDGPACEDCATLHEAWPLMTWAAFVNLYKRNHTFQECVIAAGEKLKAEGLKVSLGPKSVATVKNVGLRVSASADLHTATSYARRFRHDPKRFSHKPISCPIPMENGQKTKVPKFLVRTRNKPRKITLYCDMSTQLTDEKLHNLLRKGQGDDVFENQLAEVSYKGLTFSTIARSYSHHELLMKADELEKADSVKRTETPLEGDGEHQDDREETLAREAAMIAELPESTRIAMAVETPLTPSAKKRPCGNRGSQRAQTPKKTLTEHSVGVCDTSTTSGVVSLPASGSSRKSNSGADAGSAVGTGSEAAATTDAFVVGPNDRNYIDFDGLQAGTVKGYIIGNVHRWSNKHVLHVFRMADVRIPPSLPLHLITIILTPSAPSPHVSEHI